MRSLRLSIVSALLAGAAVAATAQPAYAISAGTPLFSSTTERAFYSRAISLSSGSILAVHGIRHGTNDWGIRVYSSANNGSSFTFRTEFKDAAFTGTKAIGSGTIYEVTPGTVLLAYNAWNENDLPAGEITKVWRSTNGGSSWTYLSTIESGGWNWEPEFSRAADGTLQVHYSYSVPPGTQFEQNIVRRQSSDNGATWGPRVTVLGNANFNMGMPRIVRTAPNRWYMAYENYESSGGVFVTSSTDGKSWAGTGYGVTNGLGFLNDSWMAVAPALTSYNGALVVTAQTYFGPGLYTPSPNNGRRYLYSKDGGVTWKETESVLQKATASFDAQYSAGLLPLSNGQLLEVNSSDDGTTKKVAFGSAVVLTP